jgi:predicted NBD/HSP70 family sugar kinase
LSVIDLDLDIRTGPTPFLATVADAAARILEGIDPRLMLGVGLGLPSPVEWSGLMTRPPESEPTDTAWDSVVVADHIRAFLTNAGIGPVPIAVDKDANVMAIGEWCSTWPDARDLVALRVGMGVTSGILAGGTVVRGAAGVAGDIGHIPDPSSDQRCRCGQLGCADLTAAGRAIVAALGPRGSTITKPQDIVALANQNDPEVIELVRCSGTRLGNLIGDVIATLNPRFVVVGGELAYDNPLLLEQIRKVALSRVHPITAQSVQIVESAMKADAGLAGAAHLALREVIDPAAVDAAIERGVVLA